MNQMEIKGHAIRLIIDHVRALPFLDVVDYLNELGIDDTDLAQKIHDRIQDAGVIVSFGKERG